MRDSKTLLKVFLGFIALSGVVNAAEKSEALTKNVIADFANKTTRADFRTTCTYDATSNKMYVGAVEAGANEYAITELSTADGSDIIKTALTPDQIYAVPGEEDLVANPLYNCRVWEMDCFIAGANKYVAALVQLEGETGVGGSRLAVINVADPKETYISSVAMSCEDATGTESRFLKLAVGHKGSAVSTVTAKVILCAVADPDTMQFDSSKSTVGIRGFEIPSSPTDNSLTQLDINGATGGSGMKMGATASMMSTKMRRLTSMVVNTWNNAGTQCYTFYLGGHMSDSTLGVCGFYLNGSDVVTTLNHSTGGTLLNGDATAAAGFPELSRVHNIEVQTNGTRAHLIVQAGASSKEKNNFYALSLKTGAAGTGGKLAQGTTDSVAAARSETWLAQATNGVYTAVGRVIVGNAPFALSPGSYVTGVSLRGNVLYVSTINDSFGYEVWVTTATVTSNNIASWSNWQRINNSALANVGAFATNGSYVWAITDGKTAYVKDALASPFTVSLPSLGLANTKDLEARVHLRNVVALDAVNKQLVVAAAVAPDGRSFDEVNNYNIATGAFTTADEVNAESPITGKGIWDMALITNADGGVDRYYLPKTETTGGKMIVKVASDGTITSITADAYTAPEGYTGNTRRETFFQDGDAVDSRCVKIVAGRNFANTANVLYCFIPDAADGDTRYFKGESEYDMIKVLNADLTVASGSIDFATLLDTGAGTGHEMSGGNIESLQCAYWEPTIRCLYLGGAKNSGDDPALALAKYTDATTIAGSAAFVDGQGSDDTFRDVYQISSLQTVGSTARTILLVNATSSAVSGKDVATGGIYAIPVLTSGANKGKPCGADYSTVAEDTDGTWSQSTNPELFNVGGASGIPWNSKAVVVNMRTVGTQLFVTIANPPGVTGLTGVFSCRAVCSAAGALVGWTPWQLVGSLSASMQAVELDATYAKHIGLDFASGRPTVATWRSDAQVSAYDQLAAALNTDFANNGGVYSLAGHSARVNTAYDLDAGDGATMNMIVATGNKAVAIAHVGYTVDTTKSTVYNPEKTNQYGYKSFLNDAALLSLGGIYCSAMSRGTAGWIFVGGENGVAALRVSGETGDKGKGWTGSLPASLQDATSSSTTPAAMTWLKLTGITGPVHKMITVYDKDTHTESLVVMTPSGVHAFTLSAAKFQDVDATALGHASLTTFTSGVSERVWDIAPLDRATGTFAVATTRGLYVCKYDTAEEDGDLTVVGEVVDGDEASLGRIASISVIAPVITAANPIYRLDLVTANARTDVSKHISVDLTINVSTGAIVGTPAVAVVKTLDRMTTQVVHRDGVYTYNASTPNRKPSALKYLAESASDNDPVDAGLPIFTGTTLGPVTSVSADGSRLISVGGRVYVQST
ncbi:hypothetical protein FJ366_01965 [Candidatus Dependentiae bacterium]|nr:hypothetical protein [Candidatus Dependentiae bacterium]